MFFFRLTFPRGHFPRLAECAHFHYETVDFGNVQVSSESAVRAERYCVLNGIFGSGSLILGDMRWS